MGQDYPFGGEPTRNESLSISTTPLSISPPHVRKEIIITNTSATQNITLSFGKQVVAGFGIFLIPGSSYYATATEGFRVSSEQLWAVSSAAGGTISVFER